MAIDSKAKRMSAGNMPWTPEGPIPDGKITLEDRMMIGGEYALPTWKSADSHLAGCEEHWTNCANSYDGSIATYAEEKIAYGQEVLELTFSPGVRAEKWRINCCQWYPDFTTDANIEVWVYHNGSWRIQYETGNTVPENEWYERWLWGDWPKPQFITKVRINSQDTSFNLRVNEFQLLDVTAQYRNAARPKVGGSLAGFNPLFRGLVR